MNLQDKQKEMANEIKKGLKDRKVSQPTFCKSFLHEYYGDSIDELEVENHYERFKKVLRLERKYEMIALYYCFYKRKYLPSGSMSDEARKAAYNFYIEMDSRIVTQPLSDGLDKNALNSLYLLFQEWRKISKENGCESQSFYEHSKKYMNELLRPFLSKWHKKESEGIKPEVFREELKTLQLETSKYIKDLKHDF